MRKIILAALLVAFPSMLWAADLPQHVQKAPVYTPATPVDMWSGFYIGANGGWMSGSATLDASASGNGTYSTNGNGWLGGVTLGVNKLYSGGFLLGLESDAQYAFATSDNNNNGLSWFGTTRARAGYLVDGSAWLVYATGGVAYGSADLGNVGPGDLRVPGYGWVAGAGTEYKLNTNWSVKAEYLYVDLYGPSVDNFASTGITANVIRGGVNYKF